MLLLECKSKNAKIGIANLDELYSTLPYVSLVMYLSTFLFYIPLLVKILNKFKLAYPSIYDDKKFRFKLVSIFLL